MAYVKLVKCAQNKSDCFAYCERKCIILTDTVFLNTNGTERPCPFYKKMAIKKKEDQQMMVFQNFFEPCIVIDKF